MSNEPGARVGTEQAAAPARRSRRSRSLRSTQLAVELGPLYGPLVVFAAETALRPAEWLAVFLARRRPRPGRRPRRAHARPRGREAVREDRLLDGAACRSPAARSARWTRCRAGSTRGSCSRRESGGHLDLDNWRRREWKPALEAAGVAQAPTVRPAAHGDHELARRGPLSVFEVSRLRRHVAWR